MGFTCSNLVALLGKSFCYVEGRAFPKVVDIWFIGKAEHAYCNILFLSGSKFVGYLLFDLFYYPAGFMFISLSACMDKIRMFRYLFYYKPGIYCYAMAAHSGARFHYVDPGVFVGKIYEFPDVYVQVVTDHAELVCERDVNIPIGIFYQLAELGGLV